jgi:hypothetical protein
MGIVAGAMLLGSGCTYWFPHSLVASDRPFGEPVTGRSDRVEASSCRSYILSIPAGGEDPTLDGTMEKLHDKAPKHHSAFRDVRVDEAWTNYFFWLVAEHCVSVSAEPVFLGAAASKPRPAAAAPSAPPPAEAPAEAPAAE